LWPDGSGFDFDAAANGSQFGGAGGPAICGLAALQFVFYAISTRKQIPVRKQNDMPRKARPHPKPARRPTFIRAWRKHRELTLAQLADRLSVELELEISEGQLSRIERGETPYSQDILEALATALRCEPADLIMRDPEQLDGIWSLLDSLKPVERLQAVEVLKALKRTGTDG
jgi:transcriptional regulator with XRE-family HTH domain